MWIIKYPGGQVNPNTFTSIRNARKYLRGGWGRIYSTMWVNDKECIVDVYREGGPFTAYIQKVG